MNDVDHRKVVYAHYQLWKSWGGDNRKDRTDIFEKEIKRTGIRPPASILEIGFGEGAFLDWAKMRGYRVQGIELLEDLCAVAKQRGHSVYCGKAEEVFKQTSRCYDLIVAFDVFEHLSILELIALLSAIKNHLSADGVVLARFPNAGSPFGGIAQYGDATHITELTGTKIDQLSRVSGLKLKNEYESYASEITERGNGLSGHKIPKVVAHKLQKLINICIGILYFGKMIPMSSVMTVILESDE